MCSPHPGTPTVFFVHREEKGIRPDDLLDSTGWSVWLAWISVAQLADNLLHRIHRPIYHNIHSFIYLSC
jgi:hypothetical protein